MPWPPELTVATALRLEWLAARRALAGVGSVGVIRVGVACRRGAPPGGIPVMVCGLAGALDPGLRPGTIFVADRVGLADGWSAACDPEVVESLVWAARRLGYEPATGALLTSPRMVTGPERPRCLELGFPAADMEAAYLARGGSRLLGAVRVILDGPADEFSLRPDGWPAGVRLALHAWTWSRRAADVIAAAATAGANVELP